MSVTSPSAVPLLLLPLLIPAVLVYFVQVRPRQRRERSVRAVQQSLRAGDRVVTAGGLHAVVVALGPGTVDLEVRPGSTHRYDRSAVVRTC